MMLKRKNLLFYQDEDLESLFPAEGLVLFDFEARPDELIERIKSVLFIGHEGLFVQVMHIATRKIPLSQVVWTDHPSYQSLWDIKEKVLTATQFNGKRDPGEEGTKTGWMPRKGKGDSYIKLRKHPELNEYILSGDGNNRVIRSLTTKNSMPFVYAKVAVCEWKASTQNLLTFIADYPAQSFHIRICNHSRFRQRDPQIYIGIRQYSDSKKFYFSSDWNDSLSLKTEVQTKENILKQQIASWTHMKWWEKALIFCFK